MNSNMLVWLEAVGQEYDTESIIRCPVLTVQKRGLHEVEGSVVLPRYMALFEVMLNQNCLARQRSVELQTIIDLESRFYIMV
jgi:hypothetical protein